MTLQLRTEREQRAVEAALRAGDVDLSGFSLILDGTDDVAAEVVDGEWGQDTSSAISMDMTLGVVLPNRLDGAGVEFWVEVAGVMVPLLVAPEDCSTFEVGEDNASTDPFWAASAAALFARTTLEEEVEFPGVPPEEIVRRALDLVGAYPRGSVRIDPLAEPILSFTRAGGNHFRPEQLVQDLTDSVGGEQTSYVLRDTAWGGHVASPAVEIGGVEPPPHRVFDAKDMPSWRPPPYADQRYDRVVVYHLHPDGSEAYRAEAPVAYRGRRKARRKTGFYVALDDVGADAPARASQLAYDLSGRFSMGLHRDEAVWPYWDALVERQDPFAVMEDHRDMDGSWSRYWLCWVDTYRHVRARMERGTSGSAGEAMRTAVGYSATLLIEDRIAAPALAMAEIYAPGGVPGVSGGVLKTVRDPYGVIGDDLYFDDPPAGAWMAVEGDEIVFFDGAPVRVEGDDLVVD